MLFQQGNILVISHLVHFQIKLKPCFLVLKDCFCQLEEIDRAFLIPQYLSGKMILQFLFTTVHMISVKKSYMCRPIF